MIQPIKQFRVTRLTISGFKGYADQKTFQFGGMNVISGHMGVGKSSIADAIAFAITGVGSMPARRLTTSIIRIPVDFAGRAGV